MPYMVGTESKPGKISISYDNDGEMVETRSWKEARGLVEDGNYRICRNFSETVEHLQSVSWILAEFCYNRSPQGPYTGTCTILQETINGFLCPLIVFRKM